MNWNTPVARDIARGISIVALLLSWSALAREAIAGNSPVAATHIYWSETKLDFSGMTLWRMPLAGGAPENLIPEAEPFYLRDMTIDSASRKLYLVVYENDLVKIQRRDLDGGNAVDLYSNSEISRFIDSVELDPVAKKVYWTESDYNTNTFLLRRSNYDGTSLENLRATSGRASELRLDLPRGKMYWQDAASSLNDALRRANLNGTGYETLVNPSGPFFIDIDPVGSSVYYAYNGGDQIFRAPLNGWPQTSIFDGLDGLDGPHDIEVDAVGRNLYWVNADSGTIQRSNLVGGPGAPVVLIDNLHRPRNIALGPIPEPASLLILVTALTAAGLCRKRKQ